MKWKYFNKYIYLYLLNTNHKYSYYSKILVSLTKKKTRIISKLNKTSFFFVGNKSSFGA